MLMPSNEYHKKDPGFVLWCFVFLNGVGKRLKRSFTSYSKA